MPHCHGIMQVHSQQALGHQRRVERVNEFPELFESPVATGDQVTVHNPLIISDGQSVMADTDLAGVGALPDEAT